MNILDRFYMKKKAQSDFFDLGEDFTWNIRECFSDILHYFSIGMIGEYGDNVPIYILYSPKNGKRSVRVTQDPVSKVVNLGTVTVFTDDLDQSAREIAEARSREEENTLYDQEVSGLIELYQPKIMEVINSQIPEDLMVKEDQMREQGLL